MEIFLVYGLVLLFFILTFAFVLGILAKHPYTDPTLVVTHVGNSQNGFAQQAAFSPWERKIAYGALALLFISLCILAAREPARGSPAKSVQEREKTIH